MTVPISTTGYAVTLIEYRTPDDAGYTTLEEDIFPTDIYITMRPDRKLPKVFLGRSAQSGCPLEWIDKVNMFKALCDGSRFDIIGAYLSGPSPRNLDEFPVSIHDGMIWITNTVTVGTPAVGTANK